MFRFCRACTLGGGYHPGKKANADIVGPMFCGCLSTESDDVSAEIYKGATSGRKARRGARGRNKSRSRSISGAGEGERTIRELSEVNKKEMEEVKERVETSRVRKLQITIVNSEDLFLNQGQDGAEHLDVMLVSLLK